MQKHRASLSQFPSQFWIPGATDLGFSFSQSFMIWKSSFWLFEILAGAFPPSRTHSPGYWLAMSVLCYMDLSTGSVAFKVEFLERWGGRGGKEGCLEASLLQCSLRSHSACVLWYLVGRFSTGCEYCITILGANEVMLDADCHTY